MMTQIDEGRFKYRSKPKSDPKVPVPSDGEYPPHIGYWLPKSRGTFNHHGCRCEDCCEAAREYQRERRRKAKS
jgi:hypothetical protein